DRRRAALAVSIEPGDRAAKHVLDPGKANLVEVELELRSRERAAETERQAVLAEHAARRLEDATDLVVANRALERRKLHAVVDLPIEGRLTAEGEAANLSVSRLEVDLVARDLPGSDLEFRARRLEADAVELRAEERGKRREEGRGLDAAVDEADRAASGERALEIGELEALSGKLELRGEGARDVGLASFGRKHRKDERHERRQPIVELERVGMEGELEGRLLRGEPEDQARVLEFSAIDRRGDILEAERSFAKPHVGLERLDAHSLHLEASLERGLAVRGERLDRSHIAADGPLHTEVGKARDRARTDADALGKSRREILDELRNRDLRREH